MVLTQPGAFQHMNRRDSREQQYSATGGGKKKKVKGAETHKGIVDSSLNYEGKNPQNPWYQRFIF